MLTVRERSPGGNGTIARPLELALDLSRVGPAPVLRRFVLGYAGMSSTAVYGFTAPRRIFLQVSRRSSDRLIRHVELALLDGASRARVAALVERADGIGTELVIPPGRYLIVASLLMPEQVEVELEVRASPVKTPLLGRLDAGGGGLAQTLKADGLRGVAVGTGPSVGVIHAPLLEGIGGGDGGGQLQPTGLGAISGRLRGIASGVGSADAAAAPFQWIDQRGRAMGPLVTIRPASWSRTAVRGIEDRLSLRLKDSGGQPLNLTGLEAVLEVWDWRRLILHATYAAAVQPNAGTVQLELDAAAVAALPEQGCWDLRLFEAASGRTVYLLQGSLEPLDRYSETPVGD